MLARGAPNETPSYSNDLHPGMRTSEAYLDRPKLHARERGQDEGKRYTEERLAFALRQAESGVPAVEVCRKLVDERSNAFSVGPKLLGVYCALRVSRC